MVVNGVYTGTPVQYPCYRSLTNKPPEFSHMFGPGSCYECFQAWKHVLPFYLCGFCAAEEECKDKQEMVERMNRKVIE